MAEGTGHRVGLQQEGNLFSPVPWLRATWPRENLLWSLDFQPTAAAFHQMTAAWAKRWEREDTHPEDIVDEEAAQQDAASADIIQVQKLHPVKGEGQAKEVVGNPVLGEGGSETSSLCIPSPHPVPAPGYLPSLAGTRRQRHCSGPGTPGPWCQTHN